MAKQHKNLISFGIWSGIALLVAVPVALATTSPYLGYRSMPYIIGGFAGILAVALFLLQPLLALGALPGMNKVHSRSWHRWVGASIVVAVLIHVGGLYITSPADTVDALLLVSPTAFSIYGVIAMWGVVFTAVLVVCRRRLRLRYSTWQLVHNGLALVVVISTVIHAVMIQGAMEEVSKWVLCLAVLATTTGALAIHWVVKPLSKRRRLDRKALSD